MSVNLSKTGAFKPPLTGLAAKRAAALAKADNITISPQEMEHRIGIVFDDSGSMCGGTKIKDAIAGTEEFLRSCEKDKTAVCIYPLNDDPLKLSSNLPALAILTQKLRPTGGTPLVSKMMDMLYNNNLTRAIVFSDGQPDNYDYNLEKIKIPVDTVYIGHDDERAESFMRTLAEKTGGIYLKFDPNTSNFRTAFKYLSPGLRYMLSDKSFVDKIQGK